MTTTALVPYQEPDAGVGLRLCRGWLVSTPSATRVRWLAPWIQAVIAEGFNAVRLIVVVIHGCIARSAQDPLRRACVAFFTAAVGVYVLMTVAPWWAFYGEVGLLLPLAWRLVVELTETREVAR